MRDRVKSLINPALLDKVQLVISQRTELDDRPAVLWLHDLPDQNGPKSALQNDGHHDYEAIVFVSHWQREQFHRTYNIPFDKTLVIYNGIPVSDEQALGEPTPYHGKHLADSDKVMQFYYASTPHRGLQLVPAILRRVKERSDMPFKFHIYSSFVLYGAPEADKQFEPLFTELESFAEVLNHGTVPNEVLREAALKDHHALVYPCIYPETYCLTMVEAMASYCHVVAPSLAALPEVAGAYVPFIPYGNTEEYIVNTTADRMVSLLKRFGNPTGRDVRAIIDAASYISTYHNFKLRRQEWNDLFARVAQQG